MFERFTDRTRRVVVIAQEEARELNHNYIGTEHLLLGLLIEGEGVAGTVLKQMGFDLSKMRKDVLAISPKGTGAPGGHIPFTPNSKKVLELAMREALQLGHNYVGTEHLLLAMIRIEDTTSTKIFVANNITLADTRQMIIQQLSTYVGPKGKPPSTSVDFKYNTEVTIRVGEHAMRDMIETYFQGQLRSGEKLSKLRKVAFEILEEGNSVNFVFDITKD